MTWLTGWTYRKSHIITGSTNGAQVNYPIKITVHYGSGTDTATDVYTSSHCATDFSDIRFTTSDGTTLLDYWVQEYTVSDNAIIWIEIDSIPASPNTVTIYIYYNKSTATTTSNFANTMIDHDDFEDGTVGQPPAGWTVGDVALTVQGSPYAKHGAQGLETKSNGSGTVSYRSITAITSDNTRAIEFWAQVVVQHINYYQYFWIMDVSNNIRITFAFRRPTSGSQNIDIYYGGAWHSLQTFNVSQWYHFKVYNIDFTNYQMDIDIDEVNKATNIGWYINGSSLNRFGVKSGGLTTEDNALDTFFTRLCVSPEPTNTSWGNEETSSTNWNKMLNNLAGANINYINNISLANIKYVNNV